MLHGRVRTIYLILLFMISASHSYPRSSVLKHYGDSGGWMRFSSSLLRLSMCDVNGSSLDGLAISIVAIRQVW